MVRDPSVVGRDVAALLRRYRCVGLVLGWPITLNGQMTVQSFKTDHFAQQLFIELRKLQGLTEELPMPAGFDTAAAAAVSPSPRKATAAPLPPPFVVPELFWWDERLSSQDAQAQLEVHKIGARELARQKDSFAAATILQEFLQRMHATN